MECTDNGHCQKENNFVAFSASLRVGVCLYLSTLILKNLLLVQIVI